MEIRLFEDAEEQCSFTEFSANESFSERDSPAIFQFPEADKDSDDDCEIIEAYDVDLTLEDNINSNAEHHPVIQEYHALLSWLRDFFESRLQMKLNNLTDFAACQYCNLPINDVFDMVFVESSHLICLFKERFSEDLKEDVVAKIQFLKIDLFRAFKSTTTTTLLIKTCSQFCRFLDSLKSEMFVTTQNIEPVVESPPQKDRYRCRFCSESFEYEYLQLRHEMKHPNLVMEKYAGMVLRNEHLLCPYCRLRIDNDKQMQQHQEAHERALKFYLSDTLKTYPARTARAKRLIIVKSEKLKAEWPYSTRCYNSKRRKVTSP